MEVEHIVRGAAEATGSALLGVQQVQSGEGKPDGGRDGHPQVQAQAKKPLKDAAAVNASRWALWRKLSENGLPETEQAVDEVQSYEARLRQSPLD